MKDVDFVRLATSSEINRRPLVLHDLQSPLVCRFIRLTVTGRHGLNATSCRTPAGFFYGHTHLLPNDLLPAQLPDSATVLSRPEIEVSAFKTFPRQVFTYFNCRTTLRLWKCWPITASVITVWREIACGHCCVPYCLSGTRTRPFQRLNTSIITFNR